MFVAADGRQARGRWTCSARRPAHTSQGLQNLYDRIERMRLLGPEFIDITWGAGGKNADLTSSLVQVCQESIGIETCMHLTCTESESADTGAACPTY